MKYVCNPINVNYRSGAVGFNVLLGASPEKLYHSYLTYNKKLHVGGLVPGRSYCVRVDAFNENGITIGTKIVTI